MDISKCLYQGGKFSRFNFHLSSFETDLPCRTFATALF